jgi:hypothetical protein
MIGSESDLTRGVLTSRAAAADKREFWIFMVVYDYLLFFIYLLFTCYFAWQLAVFCILCTSSLPVMKEA